MIIINLYETEKYINIEVSGHGDDTDQSCARVSTVCDCIQLFFSKMLSNCAKEYGYTYLCIDKVKLRKKGLEHSLFSILVYFSELEKLYSKSIKFIDRVKGENENDKNN